MKKKLFGVFNIIDILIILVFLAAVAVAFLYFRSGGSAGGVADVYFTVEFQEVEPDFASKIIEGGDVRDSTRGYYLGKVFSVETETAVSAVYDEINDVFVESEIPGKATVLLTIKANGTESDRDILAEGQPVKMGKEMTIKGKGFASEGYVVELRAEKR